jgi:FdhD protein
MERSFYSSSSCGVCGKQSIASLAIRAAKVRARRGATLAEILEWPERLRQAQTVFAQTGGVHAAGLFGAGGEPDCVREDVGRHNAVDKLIGWAARKGRLPLEREALLVSGRVSYEIIGKALAAGITLVAAIGAPSSLAVDLAEEYGLTLLGFVKGDSANVYSGELSPASS